MKIRHLSVQCKPSRSHQKKVHHSTPESIPRVEKLETTKQVLVPPFCQDMTAFWIRGTSNCGYAHLFT